MQLVARQPALFYDFFPARRFYVPQQLVETLRERLNKLMIDRRGAPRALALEKIF